MTFIDEIAKLKQVRKNNNLLRIMGLIWDKPGICRHQIATDLDMTKVSISKNVDQLFARGFVEEEAPVIGGNGRRPVPLFLKRDLFYSIGICLYGPESEAVLVDARSEIIDRLSLRDYFKATGWQAQCNSIINVIKSLLDRTNISLDAVSGIGISLPGIFDKESGLIISSSAFSEEPEFNIKDYFNTKLGKSVELINVAHLWPLLEKKWGNAQDLKSFLCFHQGYGVGMFLNNQLYSGHQFQAGEAGLVQVQADGPINVDGRVGTLGALVPFYKITDCIQELVKKNGRTEVKKYLNSETEKVTMALVIKAVRDGDKLCAQLVSETFEVIGRMVLNLAYLFNPEAILLPWWTAECPAVTIDIVDRIMGHYGVHNWRLTTRIEAGVCDHRSIGRGAALLPAIKHFGLKTLGEN